ncbi:MAG: WD40/YVTN/BNR-like repeat-containing protein [Candidatus Omnitrophota bacterium]
MAKIRILMAAIALCVFLVNGAYSENNKWEEVFKIASGSILCMEGARGTDAVYLGTSKGLYKTENTGRTWKKVNIPGKVFAVKDIAVSGGDVFVAAENGLYISKNGSYWKRIKGKKGISGVAVRRDPGEGSVVLAWTNDELFKVKDGDWKRIGSSSLWKERISDAAYRDSIIFVASGGNAYTSRDGGETWKKISLLTEEINENGSAENAGGDKEEDEAFLPAGNIDSCGTGGVAIATTRGIFIVSEESGTWERISARGLPSVRVRYVANDGEGLFAATDKVVFLYLAESGFWRPVFERPASGRISFLKINTGSGGKRRLWVADGKSLFRRDIGSLSGGKEENKRKLYGEEELGPSIIEVHRMAIKYAEVSPEKIRKWRSGAKWKALLPRLSLGFSESTDDKVEIYTSSKRAYHYTAPRQVDTGWDIDLTWDLSDLVWNDAQSNIDVRSKLMVQLRDGILEEVTRLYFERKRLLVELEGVSPEDERKLREKRMRIEELTAHIDALTGGKFSKALND